MNHSTQFLCFCAFFISEMITMFGIYIGGQMRNFRVIEIGMATAAIALISYTAAAAAIEMNGQDKETKDGSESRISEG